MSEESNRMYDALDSVVTNLNTQLEVVKRELGETNLDMRTVQTKLATIEQYVEKLRQVVIEGNGAEPLKTQMGMLRREHQEILKDLVDLQEFLKTREEEAKKNARSRNTAIAAAAIAIGSELARWVFSAKL